MSNAMTCEQTVEQLPLYLYSELTFDEEEAVEQHLHGCAVCRGALEREKSLHSMLDDAAAEVPAGVLVASRQRLAAALSAQAPAGSWWARFATSLRFETIWKPVGALAMLAIGFYGGRSITTGGIRGLAEGNGSGPAPVSRVRYVEPDAQGNVQIVFDETRQRILRGRLDDEPVRRLLLTAAREANDPGLRAETVNILGQRSQQGSEIRQALLAALENDANAGVRLKALEGLKAYAGDLETRRVLVRVLAEDDNPGVRTRVIDMLTREEAGGGLSRGRQFDAQMVGALQELVRREPNSYVRQRCEKALRDVNASAEIF